MKIFLFFLPLFFTLSTAAKEVEFRITFADATAAIPFNRATTPNNQLEYQIVFEINSDNDITTGIDGADVIVELRHVKTADAAPFNGSYNDFAVKRLVIPTASGSDIFPLENIAVVGNELVITIDENNPAVQNVSTGDPFRVFTLVWGNSQDQFHFDNTPLPLPTVGEALIDEAADIDWDFVDFTAASVVTTATGISNDNLCDAIEISLNQTCPQLAYSNAGSSLEPNEPLPGSCEFINTGTSWFKLQVPTTGAYQISCPSTDAEVNMNVRLFQATENFDCSDYTGMQQIYTNCSQARRNTPFGWTMISDSSYYLQVITEDDATGTFCVELQPNALALELTEFSGQASSTVNTIQWIAATEHQIVSYQVERSPVDRADWQTIGAAVAAVNNRNQQTTYQMIDSAPLPTALYRLKIVQSDGSSSYSEILKLTNQPSIVDLNVYPNPVQRSLLVNWHNEQSTAVVVRIISRTGREVYRQTNNFSAGSIQQRIKTHQLPAGVYWLEIVTQAGIEQQQFVKM